MTFLCSRTLSVISSVSWTSIGFSCNNMSCLRMMSRVMRNAFSASSFPQRKRGMYLPIFPSPHSILIQGARTCAKRSTLTHPPHHPQARRTCRGYRRTRTRRTPGRPVRRNCRRGSLPWSRYFHAGAGVSARGESTRVLEWYAIQSGIRINTRLVPYQ